MYRPQLADPELEKLKECIRDEKASGDFPHMFSQIHDENFWKVKHWVDYHSETKESSTLQWLCEYNLQGSEPFLKKLYSECKDSRTGCLLILVVNSRLQLVKDLVEEFPLSERELGWVLVRNPVFNELFFSKNLSFDDSNQIGQVCMSATVGDNIEIIRHYRDRLTKPVDLFHTALYKSSSLQTVKFLVEDLKVDPSADIKEEHPLKHYQKFLTKEVFEYLYPLWRGETTAEELLEYVVATEETRFGYGREYTFISSRFDLLETLFPLGRDLLKKLLIHAIDMEASTIARRLVEQL